MRHAFPHPKKIARTGSLGPSDFPTDLLVGKTGRREKVTVLCEVCNNRWLSQIESRVKPKLLAWMSGLHGSLAVHDQQLIAFWAVKTALMVQLVSEPAKRVIPMRFYKELHDARDHPPDGMYVWLGLRQARLPGIYYRHRDITKSLTNMNPRSAFQADLIIHRVLIRVSGVDPPEVLGDIEMPGLLRVWPTTPLLLHDLSSEARLRRRGTTVWVPG
jgi:hypothetical protein